MQSQDISYTMLCSCIQLAVQDRFDINSDESNTNPMIKPCSCVNSIHRSPKIISDLQQLCKHSSETFHKPALDASTGWNSTFHVIVWKNNWYNALLISI